MTRLVASALIAVVALSAVATTAHAGGTYKHFIIENPTDTCLNYQISWDGGRTWKSNRLCGGVNRLHTSWAYDVDPEIRFDADMTSGKAWRSYDLDMAVSEEDPTHESYTLRYHFKIRGKLLDLFR